MSDLRSALKALADEMDATTYRTGMDMLTAPPPRRIRAWAERIRELLATHEEREGGAESFEDLPAFYQRTIEDAQSLYPITEDGLESAHIGATEAWVWDMIRRLRFHTDREGDAACPHLMATGAEVVRLYRCDECGEVRGGYVDDRVTDPLGSTPDAPHYVGVFGPPVQPEEESDV